MDTITNDFEQHQIHVTLSSLLKTLAAKKMDDNFSVDFLRANAMAKYVERVLSQADPLLILSQTLDKLNQELGKLTASVEGNIWNNIMGHCDAILSILARVPIFETPDGTREFFTQFSDFFQKAQDALNDVKVERDHIKNELNTLQEEYARQQKRLTEFNEEMDKLQARTDSVISEFQTKYLDSATKQNELFSAHVNSFKEDYEKFKNNLTTTFKTLEDNFSGTTNDLIDKIKEQNSKAEKLVGIIAQTGTAGHYDRIANREWWASEVLRYGVIASILAVIVIIVWAFCDVHKGNLNWDAALIFRVSISLPLIGLAIYCARESSRHRSNEIHNRQIALELASVGPYLNDLPQAKKEILLEEFAKKYFGKIHDEENVDASSSVHQWIPHRGMSVARMLKLMEQLAKIVRS